MSREGRIQLCYWASEEVEIESEEWRGKWGEQRGGNEMLQMESQ